MEVMERLDTVEKESKKEIKKLNDEISDLKKEKQHLKDENKLLRDDNARMKSILDNDSSNTSLPPSTDQKGGNPANTYNGREKTGRKAAVRKDIKALPLQKRRGKKKSVLESAGTRSKQLVIPPENLM